MASDRRNNLVEHGNAIILPTTLDGSYGILPLILQLGSELTWGEESSRLEATILCEDSRAVRNQQLPFDFTSMGS